MEEVNPYQQPATANVQSEQSTSSLALHGGVGKVGVGQALGWLGEGARMLSGHWGPVIGALVVAFLIYMAVSMIPLVGYIAPNFLLMLLYAGIVQMFFRIEQEGRSDFGDLFAGFSNKTGPLLLLALVQFAAIWGVMIAMIAGMVAMAGVDMAAFSALESGDPAAFSNFFTAGMITMMVLGFVAMILLTFPFYFAVPLIFLGDRGLGEAMKMSTLACLKNFIPLLVYGIVAGILSLVAALPILLGWLVLMPILAGAYYQAFKDVFVES